MNAPTNRELTTDVTRLLVVMVRKIGLSTFAIGVLVAATTLVVNLFPDRAYAVIQKARALTETHAAIGIVLSSPAPQGTRNSSDSPTQLYVLLSGSEKEISKLCSRPGPKVDGG